MDDLSKRILTSIPLFIILYSAIINHHVLFLLFIIISFAVMIEVYGLFKKIFRKHNNKFILSYLILIIYLSFCLPQLYFFITLDNNKLIFIYLLLVCIMTDLGGYIFGKFFRGKKLIKISPNKTYSGLIGSYILSNMVFVYFYLKFNFSYSFLIITFLVCSISQIGDLFVSYLKRKAKVKDTGVLLPGHGGILDRIDGIIFALPIGINLLYLFK